MSVILPPAPPHHESVAAPAARLMLKPTGPSRGLLDGAWWPRSRDLVGELPALVEALEPLWGRVTRVAVNPEHWPVVPRRVAVRGRVVRVGWFTPELDPHKLLLLSYGTSRWDLLVVPPESTEPTAARLMAAASAYEGQPLTASELIAAEQSQRAAPEAGQPLDPDEVWESEGGAAPGTTDVPEPMYMA